MYTSLSYIICIARVFDDHRSCQKLINYITYIKTKSKRYHWIQKIPVLKRLFIHNFCKRSRCLEENPVLPVLFLAHLTQRVRPSVNFSHFNQLLWSNWANLNQTLVEWSLDGPLPKLCPVIPTSNQDGRQAKNRKKGGWNFDCSLLL